MGVYGLRWRTWLGMILLVVPVVVLNNTPADPRVGATSSGVASDWGQPCSPIHPSACYTGPGGQLTEVIFDSAGQAMIPASVAPAAVELICFYAEGGDGYVEVQWETASELETLGFHLLRSDNPEGPFQDISGFVPHCDDGGLVGGLYLFTDQGLQNGLSYYYRLQEVASDQHYVYYPPQGEPPLVALPNLPTSTPTLTIPPSATATQRPSATPTATRTPSPTPTRTLAPTSPPAPTGSPPPTATSSPTVIARTFTPTPAPSEAVAVDVTPIIQPSRPPATTAQVASTQAQTAGSTPSLTAQVVGHVLDSPLAAPENTLSSTAYPLATLATPPRSPLPTAYVPPPTRHPNQIATMTPVGAAGLDTGPGDSAEHANPRVWLYVGFVGSALILVASLAAVVRQSQNRPSLPAPTESEQTQSSDDRPHDP